MERYLQREEASREYLRFQHDATLVYLNVLKESKDGFKKAYKNYEDTLEDFNNLIKYHESDKVNKKMDIFKMYVEHRRKVKEQLIEEGMLDA